MLAICSSSVQPLPFDNKLTEAQSKVRAWHAPSCYQSGARLAVDLLAGRHPRERVMGAGRSAARCCCRPTARDFPDQPCTAKGRLRRLVARKRLLNVYLYHCTLNQLCASSSDETIFAAERPNFFSYCCECPERSPDFANYISAQASISPASAVQAITACQRHDVMPFHNRSFCRGVRTREFKSNTARNSSEVPLAAL